MAHWNKSEKVGIVASGTGHCSGVTLEPATSTALASSPLVVVVSRRAVTRRLLHRVLVSHGYRCTSLEDVDAARHALSSWAPDLVVLALDVGPEDAGALRTLRAASRVPLVATAADPEVRAQALDDDADDAVPEPLVAREIVARVAAALRRAARAATHNAITRMDVGALSVDTAARIVRVGEDEIRLTSTEYRLLTTLAGSPGVARTHDDLLEAVWGEGHAGRHHYVRICVANLRRKLASKPAAPRCVRTVRGVGYVLHVEPSPS